MAKLSVVLATYNGEKYLQQMLDSLVAQTRPADLVVAVDDGSKDSTVQILKSFENKLPLKIFVSEKNQGHRAAFSKALEIARQELSDEDYIALADQDDIWLSHKHEVLISAIEGAAKNGQQKPALVFGDAQVIDKNGMVTAQSWRDQALIEGSVSIEQQLAGINNVTGCLCLFRASLLSKILPIPEGVTVHDRWIAMMAQKNGGVLAIGQPVVQYRIHGENAVGGAKQESMSKTLATQISWASAILSQGPRLNLSASEEAFGQRLILLSQKRQRRYLAIEELPWIFRNRKNLFLKGSAIQTCKRVLFSALGLPLAQKIFNKS